MSKAGRVAQPGALAFDFRTPLWKAAHQGHKAVVGWLLAAGAADEMEQHGQRGSGSSTALWIAQQRRRTAIVTMLRDPRPTRVWHWWRRRTLLLCLLRSAARDNDPPHSTDRDVLLRVATELPEELWKGPYIFQFL